MLGSTYRNETEMIAHARTIRYEATKDERELTRPYYNKGDKDYSVPRLACQMMYKKTGDVKYKLLGINGVKIENKDNI